MESKRVLKILAFSLLGLAALLGAGWWWYNRDLSIYAKGYTEKAFHQVTVGMQEQQVYALLGLPLSIEEVRLPEAWSYDGPVKENSFFSPTYNLLGAPNRIEFNRDGRVIKVGGRKLSEIRMGMSKTQVLDLVGPPKRVIPPRHRVLHYSAPSGAGTYRARIIGVDQAGLVTRVTTYDMQD